MSQPPAGSDKPASGLPFSADEALQFMQRIWSPFGLTLPGFGTSGMSGGAPGGGSSGQEAQPAASTPAPPPGLGFPNPASMFPTLDPDEIERKIEELRIIENWLQMCLNFMQMSIKTMELQKASLEALTAGHGSGHGKSKSKPHAEGGEHESRHRKS